MECIDGGLGPLRLEDECGEVGGREFVLMDSQ